MTGYDANAPSARVQTVAPASVGMRLDKPLGVAVFRRLAERLSARQLLDLPTACLPYSIPLDAVDGDREPEKWGALEELIWRASERDMDQNSSDLDRLGEAAIRALDVCETETADGAEELRSLCDQIAEPCRRADPARDPLSDTSHTLERASARATSIAERIGRLGRALATIDEACGNAGTVQPRIAAARRRARQTQSRLEWALARFHMIELDVAANAMRDKALDCDLEIHRIQDLDQRIASVEYQVDRDNRVVERLLRPAVARRQRETRIQRLEQLRRDREGAEVFIDEDCLLRWLDVLVTTSLFTDRHQWQERAHTVRQLLYRLLTTYCLQQELSAHEVARRAIPGINGRMAIDYYLKSEEFILGYFARKRKDVMQWLAGAAEDKLAQLDHIRDTLLTEYRQSLRNRSCGRPEEPIAAIA